MVSNFRTTIVNLRERGEDTGQECCCIFRFLLAFFFAFFMYGDKSFRLLSVFVFDIISLKGYISKAWLQIFSRFGGIQSFSQLCQRAAVSPSTRCLYLDLLKSKRVVFVVLLVIYLYREPIDPKIKTN